MSTLSGGESEFRIRDALSMTLVQVCRSDSFFHQHYRFSTTLSSLYTPSFLWIWSKSSFMPNLVRDQPPSSHCLCQWFFRMVFRQDRIGGCRHTIPKRRTCWLIARPSSSPRPWVHLVSSPSGFQIPLFFSYRLVAFYMLMLTYLFCY